MTGLLSRLCWKRNIIPLFYETTRFAGHNKWSNIKHIKESEDAKKQLLFSQLRRAMVVAIREGKSANPDENIKLRQVIDRAKIANMPVATIKRCLESFNADKSNYESYFAEIKGSGGYTMVINYVTDTQKKVLSDIKSRTKKYGAKVMETKSKGVFDHFCLISAQKDCTLDQAIEDAIVSGAEEVEEVEEEGSRYLQFRCSHEEGPKVATRLKTLKYNVCSTEDVFVPLTLVQLDEDDSKMVSELKKKLLELESIEKLADNIDNGES